MMDFELVTVSAREPWRTVAQGGNWVTSIEYHEGLWTCPAPEVRARAEPVGPDGRDSEGRLSLAPVGLGYPLAGVPRGALLGRTVDEEGRAGEPFLVGRRADVGPFPNVNPDYFLIQLGPNSLSPHHSRGAIRVRVRRRRPEEVEPV